jgi:hypothetical protein
MAYSKKRLFGRVGPEKRKANLKLSPTLALPMLPDAVPYCGILFYRQPISDLYSRFNQVKSHLRIRALTAQTDKWYAATQ